MQQSLLQFECAPHSACKKLEAMQMRRCEGKVGDRRRLQAEGHGFVNVSVALFCFLKQQAARAREGTHVIVQAQEGPSVNYLRLLSGLAPTTDSTFILSAADQPICAVSNSVSHIPPGFYLTNSQYTRTLSSWEAAFRHQVV